MSNLLSIPRLVASMSESPHYQTMGVGLTNRLFLLGHSDHLKLNDPYPVASIREAINDLGADTDSPLLLSLLEAYFSGARDIWLVAAAPMSEYEPDLTERNAQYYSQYRQRLNTTYSVLKKWDIAQITVPIDAPFNVFDSFYNVDFLGPLVNYCTEALNLSGDIHLGIMGTRGLINNAMVNSLANDGRLSKLGESGKFVSVFVGDATYHLKEMPFNHTASVAVGVAAELSQLPLDRSLSYHRLRNVITLKGRDLTKEQMKKLAEAGLNPVGRNVMGRRGVPFNIIPFTDNTLAKEGSDFWSLTQMRLVTEVSHQIRSIGHRAIGTIGMDIFRGEVEEYLIGLSTDNIIRDFDLSVRRNERDRRRVNVDVNLHPYFGVRELQVNIKVGPQEG